MPKNKQIEKLKTVASSLNLQTTTVKKPPTENREGDYCPSKKNRCAAVDCSSCSFTPKGVWVCIHCADPMMPIAKILPYYADVECYYCGIHPLLCLLMEIKND